MHACGLGGRASTSNTVIGRGDRVDGTYRIISADSHVNEPPDLWRERVPARFRDRAPRIESFDQGDAWVLEGVADPITFGMNACAGLAPEEMRAWPRRACRCRSTCR